MLNKPSANNLCTIARLMKLMISLIITSFFVHNCLSQQPIYNSFEEYTSTYLAKDYLDKGDIENCKLILDTLFNNVNYSSPVGFITGLRCYSALGATEMFDTIAKRGEQKGTLLKGKRAIKAKYPSIRDTLIRIFIEDQGEAIDQTHISTIHSMNLSNLLSDNPMIRFNSNQAVHVAYVLDLCTEFPIIKDEDYSYLGKRAIFLVLIHSNLEVLKNHLEFIEKNYSRSDYAYYYDKYKVLEGLPQKFGTQTHYDTKLNREVFYPIKSLKQVDSLRMNVGLEPLEYYAKKMNVLFDH